MQLILLIVSTVGANPYGIFVNTNNTIYVADQANSRIQIWFNDSINPTRTISGGLSNPFLFSLQLMVIFMLIMEDRMVELINGH